MRYRLVDLIRHGEVEGGPCFRGRRDDPLSAAGWAQLESATGIGPQAVSDKQPRPAIWERILCSPAVRCAQFADQLGAQLGVPVERLDALRERDFGAWEGLRADQLPLDELARFWADPSSYDPPDSEPFTAFHQRVLTAWQQVLDAEGSRLLVLTHGGVIRVILGALLGIPAERLILLEVPPACRSRLRVPISDGLPSLVAHGASPAVRSVESPAESPAERTNGVPQRDR
jgi:alpha-ribazole phosphatase